MIAFGVLAAIVLVSSLMVVVSRNPVVSAMWLALTLASVAGVFVVLGAEFLAAVQLIVYAGAILVFFLFVIMLLNPGKLPAGEPRPVQRWLGFGLALTIGGVLLFSIQRTVDWGTGSGQTLAELAPYGNAEAIARVLFSNYLVAFELTSVLLTVAVVGAVALARKAR